MHHLSALDSIKAVYKHPVYFTSLHATLHHGHSATDDLLNAERRKCNTLPWVSPLESVLQAELSITAFCMLAATRVRHGITTKETDGL